MQISIKSDYIVLLYGDTDILFWHKDTKVIY